MLYAVDLLDGATITGYICGMKTRASWADKLFDEPRIGFVAEYGSQQHPRFKLPEPPPAPLPSPLDKILDEERLGFAGERRAEAARALAQASRPKRGRPPRAR